MAVLETKVPNEELLEAGLQLMAQTGKPLERIQTRGRSMIYRTSTGSTVRVRTCNDHVLVALADAPVEGARLNIEGTDELLIVMPEVPRVRGPTVAYLVPTEVAAEAVRKCHANWLATNPDTNGKNRTWNIWFSDDAPEKSNGFARKWAEYRLPGTSDLNAHKASTEQTTGQSLGEVIAEARRRIASAAGISESAVKITLELS